MRSSKRRRCMSLVSMVRVVTVGASEENKIAVSGPRRRNPRKASWTEDMRNRRRTADGPC